MVGNARGECGLQRQESSLFGQFDRTYLKSMTYENSKGWGVNSLFEKKKLRPEQDIQQVCQRKPGNRDGL